MFARAKETNMLGDLVDARSTAIDEHLRGRPVFVRLTETNMFGD